MQKMKKKKKNMMRIKIIKAVIIILVQGTQQEYFATLITIKKIYIYIFLLYSSSPFS